MFIASNGPVPGGPEPILMGHVLYSLAGGDKMATSNRALKQLTELGLNTYEAKALMALQEKNDITASELAKSSGIPRQRIYDVLDALQLKGLCSEIPGPVLRYRAAEIRSGLINMLVERNEQFQSELEEQRGIALSIADSVENGDRASNGTNNRFIQVIRNPTQMLLRYDQMLLETETEVIGTRKLPYIQSMAEETHEKISDGVEVHFLIERVVFKEAPGMIEAIFRLYSEHEHRFHDDLPMNFTIFDRKKVMLNLPYDNKYGIVCLIIESGNLANTLGMMFDILWQQGDPHTEELENIARAIEEVRQ